LARVVLPAEAQPFKKIILLINIQDNNKYWQ